MFSINSKDLLKPIYSRGSLGQQIVEINVGEPYTVPPGYILQKFIKNTKEYKKRKIKNTCINYKIDKFIQKNTEQERRG